MRYNPAKIEKKWQVKWLKDKTYEPSFAKATEGRGRRAKRPYYNLMMFPYPSAEGLHVGNVYAFTGSDIYGRFKRMQGHDVFEPIGLDGFGIHSENYALKIGKHPAEQAKISEKNFYRQLRNIGNGFAWNEHLETYDPKYYKWTQWIFVQMFKKGLAYRKKAKVNWCPSCKTVLADEQVINGNCERCSTAVIKKDLEQWFFKITDYAERLLKNLEKIDWSEKIKIAQRNWIGKSEGAEIEFRIQNTEYSIGVFTTRPDTLLGATYMVLAPEHSLLTNSKLPITNRKEVDDYIKAAAKKSEIERTAETKDKTGIELRGVKAINPANKEEIPIWISDYVLASYGTGAIMAVPAHDERDFQFAKKYNLPIVNVIEPTYGEPQGDEVKKRAVISVVHDPQTDKVIVLNWGSRQDRYGGNMLIGGTMREGEDLEKTARREITEETGYTDLKLVKKSEAVGHGYFYSNVKNHNVHVDAYGLYFELQSSARRPVKLDHGEKNKFAVEWHPREKVAAMLHDGIHEYFYRTLALGESYQGKGILANSGKFNGMDSEKAKWEITKFVRGGKKIQYRLRDWLLSRQRYWGPPIPMIYCEKCGWLPVPEKDLPVELPFIKNFRPTGTNKSPLASVKSFYETKCPKCGGKARRETDVSDTFLDSAWYFLRYPSVKDKKYPWNPVITKHWLPVQMYIGGAEHSVLHLLYSRFLTMVFRDWGMLNFEEPFTIFRAHGLIIKDGVKMSKSKGNIVNPDDYIKAYGADALRLYLMFTGPFQEGGDFRDAGIAGMTRFLNRVWKFFEETGDRRQETGDRGSRIKRAAHKAIKKVTEDIAALRYNTAISALMILLNEFEKDPAAVSESDRRIFLQLLAPFAPHIAEELWQMQKGKGSIHKSFWPSYDEKLIHEDTFQLIVQVNGRVRGRLTLPRGISQNEAEKAARSEKSVASYTAGTLKKVVFVKDRLINFVL